MTQQEIVSSITAVLNTLDDMSKSGAIELRGNSAIKGMAGCIGVLQNLAEEMTERTE